MFTERIHGLTSGKNSDWLCLNHMLIHEQLCIPGNAALKLTQPCGSVGHWLTVPPRLPRVERKFSRGNEYFQTKQHAHHTFPTQSPCLQYFYPAYPPWDKIIFLKCRMYYVTLKTLKNYTLLREHSTNFFTGLQICTLFDLSNLPFFPTVYHQYHPVPQHALSFPSSCFCSRSLLGMTLVSILAWG